MKKIILILFCLCIQVYAQSTTITLPTANNASNFNVTNSSTTLMKLNGDGGFYLNGTYGTGTIPIDGAGTRMMWYPTKAAFRVGSLSSYGSSYWNAENIGNSSIAAGMDVTASGNSSTAMGYHSVASGAFSAAIGYYPTSSGNYSTAMGANATASGAYSTAFGYNTTASGYASTAMGYSATASGDMSIAMGSFVSTNSKEGAFFFGDNSTFYTTTNSSADNQMTMRFAGGYKFYTNSDCTVGVTIAGSGNSWSSISDSTKKINFMNADGEYFLNSLSKLKLGSWNYKSQDAKQFRHYGPMAQEIFHYFGKDELGVIGNDTTLASTDMDGIMMICLQALEKRTEELMMENGRCKMENVELEKKVSEISKRYAAIGKENEEMKNEIVELKNNFEEMKTLVAGMARSKETTTEIAKE